MDYATGGVVKWTTGLTYLDTTRSFHIGTGTGTSNAKLTIAPGGNVGIGTTTPQYQVEISKDDDARLLLTDTGDSSKLLLRSDGVNTSIGTQTNHDVQLTRNNATIATIKSTGIDVTGSVTCDGLSANDSSSQHIFGHNLNSNAGPTLKLATSANVYSSIVFNTVNTDHCHIRGSSYGLAIGGAQPHLNIGFADANYNESLVVNGNVAIGDATAANERLSIRGPGHSGHGATNTRSLVSIGETVSGNTSGLWLGSMITENTAVIGSRTASGNIAFQTYNGGWGERMRIRSDGNVGIGSVGSSSAKLDISNGTSPAYYQVSQVSGNTAKFGIVGGSDIEISGTSNNDIYFKRAGGEKLRIDSAGINVTGRVLASSFQGSGSGIYDVLSTYPSDNRSIDEKPSDRVRGFYADFKNNSTSNIPGTSGYIGQLTFRSYGGSTDLSGGQPSQLAYDQTGQWFTRLGTGAQSWGDWSKFKMESAAPISELFTEATAGCSSGAVWTQSHAEAGGNACTMAHQGTGPWSTVGSQQSMGGGDGWHKVVLPNSITATHVGIIGYEGGSHHPTYWTVEGLNGSAWVTLFTSQNCAGTNNTSACLWNARDINNTIYSDIASGPDANPGKFAELSNTFSTNTYRFQYYNTSISNGYILIKNMSVWGYA
jgi:hypothetical protein